MPESRQQAATDLETLAIECARLVHDLKCEDVVVLDVRELSQVTKYIVIGTGTSDRQIRSVAKDVVDLGVEHGHNAFRSNLERSTTWAIVDFVDLTVHLFEANTRAFYDLESLWGEAPHIPWAREGRGRRGPGAAMTMRHRTPQAEESVPADVDASSSSGDEDEDRMG